MKAHEEVKQRTDEAFALPIGESVRFRPQETPEGFEVQLTHNAEDTLDWQVFHPDGGHEQLVVTIAEVAEFVETLQLQEELMQFLAGDEDMHGACC